MDLRPYLLPPAVFVVAGPGIGFITAVISTQRSSLHEGLAFGLLISYAFAWIPALASGCLYVVLWPLFSRFRMLGIRGIGGLTGLATVTPLLVYLALAATPPKSPLFALVFTVPATLCGMLAATIRAGLSPGSIPVR